MSAAPNLAWMSDIYGTAIEESAPKPISGFVGFMEGVNITGPLFHGFVTRRTDTSSQRHTTTHAINEMGLQTFFTVVHTGSLKPWESGERRKAKEILSAAVGYAAFGFVDDAPERIGIELMLELNDIEGHPSSTEGVNILLGAVGQPQGDNSKIQRVFDAYRDAKSAGVLIDNTNLIPGATRGFIAIGKSSLSIVTVDQLNLNSGMLFGENLARIAANTTPEA